MRKRKSQIRTKILAVRLTELEWLGVKALAEARHQTAAVLARALLWEESKKLLTGSHDDAA